MNSSGKTTRSAPCAAAATRARRTFSALPAMSPTVELSCATAIASLSAGRAFMALTYAWPSGRQSRAGMAAVHGLSRSVCQLRRDFSLADRRHHWRLARLPANALPFGRQNEAHELGRLLWIFRRIWDNRGILDGIAQIDAGGKPDDLQIALGCDRGGIIDHARIRITLAHGAHGIGDRVLLP